MGQAAAARAARPTHGRARPARPCAALGRGGKHVAAAAAGAGNMMHSILSIWFELHKIFMGTSICTAARPPRSVRQVPCATWAARGRAGCALPPL